MNPADLWDVINWHQLSHVTEMDETHLPKLLMWHYVEAQTLLVLNSLLDSIYILRVYVCSL